MAKTSTDALFDEICEDMKRVGREATGKEISHADAVEAANNLIGFYRCLRDMAEDKEKREQAGLTKPDEIPGDQEKSPAAEN